MKIIFKAYFRILFKDLVRYIYCRFLKMIGVRKERVPELFIPFNLMRRYSMNGKVRFSYNYRDDSYPLSCPIVYTREMLNSYIEKAGRGEVFYYQKTDTWLYQALEKYSIKDKQVIILGSRLPVYESICLVYGGMPTTVEYNSIVSGDLRLKIMAPEKCLKSKERFDAAFSISSFEHDGLGRYGDALNPDGDLEIMEKLRLILKAGGLLFLSVPVGPDELVWNLNRIYGRLRLPLLLKGWQILDTFGFSESLFDCKDSSANEPVFVLKNLTDT